MFVVSALSIESESHLGAGRLCLEFANTVDWHASDLPQDTLHSYSDLLAWAQKVGIVAESVAPYIADRAAAQPEMAHSIFAQAIEFREALYRIFTSLPAAEAIAPADLAVLNDWIEAAYAGLHITPSVARFEWRWPESESLAALLYPVVRSAATLLTSEDLTRVGQCADDRGCGYLFFDTSRNRSRRWCDMAGCGNRAKVRRHMTRKSSEGHV